MRFKVFFLVWEKIKPASYKTWIFCTLHKGYNRAKLILYIYFVALQEQTNTKEEPVTFVNLIPPIRGWDTYVFPVVRSSKVEPHACNEVELSKTEDMAIAPTHTPFGTLRLQQTQQGNTSLSFNPLPHNTTF